MGYEVSRLSRSCADWHRLLELCALFDTLIGDADGIYNPRDFNDRLLLGLKGTLSEAELHSIRLRLDAGRLSKAGRGELAQSLPTGLVRDENGVVRFDPDQSIRDRTRLVFAKFREPGTARQVMCYLVTHSLKLPRRHTTGPHAGTVFWKEADTQMLISLLKNPAYAGAFAYGRRRLDPARQVAGRHASGRIRQSRPEWLVLVKDVDPAYITWEEYEQNLATIEENRQTMEERLSRKRAIRSGAALLTGLVRCGLCGHAMRVIYKDYGHQYQCKAWTSKYAKPNCQYLAGKPIDEAVVQEFFRVLQLAEIDAIQRVDAKQMEHQRELERHLEQEVKRLDYAAKRAERQNDNVDPENRLIASTLETRWESALAELEQSKARLAELRTHSPQPVAIPAELRDAFADAGRRLPELWERLPIEARKTMLRALVAGVNLSRDGSGVVRIRIVWRGGLVSEQSIKVPVGTIRGTERERCLVERIRTLACAGHTDMAIAEQLEQEGFTPCKGGRFTAEIVSKHRSEHQIRSGLGRLRRGDRPPGYTIIEMAQQLDIDPQWIYRGIAKGRIEISKDSRYGCYLFPRTKAAVARMKQLKCGKVHQVIFRKEHGDD